MDQRQVGLLEISNALAVAVSQDLMNREHAKQVWNKALDLAGINTPKPVYAQANAKPQVKETKVEAKVEAKPETAKESA